MAALVRDGKKIQAIKEYREFTGVGLKEAKDAVERME
ncbi:ribosomal protein L7/L12 [Streptomyces kaempferi]